MYARPSTRPKTRILLGIFLSLTTLCLNPAGCRRAQAPPRRLSEIPYRPLQRLLPEPTDHSAKSDHTQPPLKPDTPVPAQAEVVPQRWWGQMVHRIRPGDTLYRLARTYYGDAACWVRIYENNRGNMRRPDDMAVGNLLYLPLDSPADDGRCTVRQNAQPDYYITAPGDTLYKIAQRFGGDGKEWIVILRSNQDVLDSPDKLRVGMMLSIPKGL